MPDTNRIMVKLDASIVLSPNANRHSTELAAKAVSASAVKRAVFMKGLWANRRLNCIIQKMQ